MFTLYIPIMVKLSISFINGQSFAYVLGKNPQAAYKCESWSFKQSSRTTKHLPTAAFIKSVVELSPPFSQVMGKQTCTFLLSGSKYTTTVSYNKNYHVSAIFVVFSGHLQCNFVLLK